MPEQMADTPPNRAASTVDEKQFALEQERFQRGVRMATPFISVAIAVLVGSLVILASGKDPVAAFSAMFFGAFGGARQIGETLLRATPLVFTGLAVAYGFRSGLFNIGAEGQLFLGGLAAAFMGVALGGLSWMLSVPLILLSAMIAGAAWAFIPALMKAKLGAHEVITTMMFTYIGRYLVSWIVTGPFKAEGAIPQSPMIPASSQLPRISDVFTFIQPNRAHFGILIGVVAAIVVWWILKYTVLGYEARAVGFNPTAAETGGISVAATTIKSLCISGALAGLAGATEVMGVHYRLFDQFSSGFGFTGIAVALLAKNNPLGVVAAAILFGSLSAGAGTMQLEAGVSQKVISIIQGTIIFLVGAETIVSWAVSRVRRARGGADV
ncbi:MAG: ABC transporter permease [Actinobacteria bacterium HGW-Actinobacteria-7]|nr:MAG: ABC transporter permease [Actinobacteria bacterium HGW-Actinobacteria-7]